MPVMNGITKPIASSAGTAARPERRRHQLLPAAALLAAQAQQDARGQHEQARERDRADGDAERAQVEAQVRPDREHQRDGDRARP